LLITQIAMGLDVTYYRQVKFVKREEEEEDEQEDYIYLCQADGFKARSDELVTGNYIGERKGCFGSNYSGHNSFRKNLYKAIGGKKWINNFPDVKDGEPFAELIYMSDCEGFIGPKTSAKLYDDFVKYEEQVKQTLSEDDFDYYSEWKSAFECAKQNGVVRFH
jgi:hypothetical protein